MWIAFSGCTLYCIKMRALLLLSVLLSLLYTALGQTAPTTDPEDYRLTFRRPDGCNISDCSYFAGVQTNEDDPAYLDFYLEGTANGWIAIGVSETPNMFNADVLGCNVLSGDNSVVAVDTWNPNSRANDIDSTQNGLTQHSSSFEGGRIICSFSRTNAAMDAGQDLNLDGDYSVLYATGNGQAASAASPLTPQHSMQSRGVGGVTMNLVTDSDTPQVLEFVPPIPPVRAPEDSRLIVSDPPDCDRPTCDLFIGISTNANSSFFDFYIEGDAAGWVAVGFSETQNMFSADVLGCSVISGTATVEVVDTWNFGSTRLNTIDNTQEGLYPYNTSLVDGRISCSFSRFTGIVNPGLDVDLADGEYFILFGVGESPASSGAALPTHQPGPNPALTRRANVAQAEGRLSSQITTRERLIRAHGILMIIAWPVLAVTAIFFAAWMRPALPNGEWFQVHRAFLITSLFVGALGFLLIFVAFRDNDPPGLITFTDNRSGTAHFVIGIIVMALHIANPIIAIFRCHPGEKRRGIFNLLHGSIIGHLTQTLALINVSLGTSIFSRVYSRFPVFWVYLGYGVFLFVLIVGLYILFSVLSYTGYSEGPSFLRNLSSSSSKPKNEEVEMSAVPAGAASKDTTERKPPSKDAPIRWAALAIYLVVMISIMFTVIVIIAQDP